ncbi:hypothetical protein KCU62_g530, partial [Aureobasidium sp. EXF-3399]
MTAPAYRDEKGNPAPHREPNFLPTTPPNDTSTPDYAVAASLNVSANFHEEGRSFCCSSQTLNILTLNLSLYTAECPLRLGGRGSFWLERLDPAGIRGYTRNNLETFSLTTPWLLQRNHCRHASSHLSITLAEMPSRSPTISDGSWEILGVIEEGRNNDERAVPRSSYHRLEKPDRTTQSRLRNDHVLRQRIIIAACVGSFLFLAVLGFGVGLFAA